MEAVDEGSLSLKTQTLGPLLQILWPVQITPPPPLTFGSYFLTPRDPWKQKIGELVGSGNTSMAFEFGPNPTVRPEVIITGEKHPWDRKQEIRGKKWAWAN